MTDDEKDFIERTADAAAKKAVAATLNEFYSTVGKGVVWQVLKWIGMGAVAFYLFYEVRGNK